MVYLIAIDVGIQNLAFIVYCMKTKCVVCWQRVAIAGDDKYMPQNNVEYIYSLVQQHKEYFDNAIKIVVERQMRANMRIIEAILHAMFYPVCEVMSAKFVKQHFDLSTKNYRQNKKVAVDWVQAYLDSAYQADVRNLPECREIFSASNKKDDLADALLMLLYFLNTYYVSGSSDSDGVQPLPVACTQQEQVPLH